MKRWLCLMAVVLSLVVVSAGMVAAATKEQIEAAVDKGVTWLVSQQQADGRWTDDSYSSTDVGYTGLALLKLIDRSRELGYEPFDSAGPYYTNIVNGFNYLFAHSYDAAPNGILFRVFSVHEVYETAIAVMAIANTKDKTRTASGGAVDGMTFEAIVNQAVQYLLACQTKSGLFDGGWGYNLGSVDGWADNSNTGWAVLGLIYAQNLFGVSIPADVATHLSTFMNYVQNDVNIDPLDGGSGYHNDTTYVNALKTGNLLYEGAFVGDTAATQRMKDAVDFIVRHWAAEGAGFTDMGWRNNYHAMYCLMKGFDSLGIKEITVGGNPVDWFDEISTFIVDHQLADGSWPDTYLPWFNNTINSIFALLTLERVVEKPKLEVYFDIQPGSCPNSFNPYKKGVLPVAILGTADFDVTKIDPATVKLCYDKNGDGEFGEGECLSPIRWSLEDAGMPVERSDEYCDCGEPYGPNYDEVGNPYYDHLTDLALKFDAPSVAALIGMQDVGTKVQLTITGNLKSENGDNGRPFTGTDCVRIVKK